MVAFRQGESWLLFLRDCYLFSVLIYASLPSFGIIRFGISFQLVLSLLFPCVLRLTTSTVLKLCYFTICTDSPTIIVGIHQIFSVKPVAVACSETVSSSQSKTALHYSFCSSQYQRVAGHCDAVYSSMCWHIFFILFYSLKMCDFFCWLLAALDWDLSSLVLSLPRRSGFQQFH